MGDDKQHIPDETLVRASSAHAVAGPLRVIKGDRLENRHREFFKRLTFISVGVVDTAGKSWVTIFSGRAGFIEVLSPTRLRVLAPTSPRNPAIAGLGIGDAVCLIGIELATGQRNRISGTVARHEESVLEVDIKVSYDRCVQYIPLRHFFFVRDPKVWYESRKLDLCLGDSQVLDILSHADAFYISTYKDRPDATRQVDIAYEAGKPGFVSIDDIGWMDIPNLVSCCYIETVSNLISNPQCGLLFVDSARGNALQMSGQGAVSFSPSSEPGMPPAHHLRFKPSSIVLRAAALPFRLSSPVIDSEFVQQEMREH